MSFILSNLSKPVIITGSQIPLSEIRSDGRYNLITAVMIAGCRSLLMKVTIKGEFQIPEVCIFFDDLLFRGNRCKKSDIWGVRAFERF